VDDDDPADRAGGGVLRGAPIAAQGASDVPVVEKHVRAVGVREDRDERKSGDRQGPQSLRRAGERGADRCVDPLRSEVLALVEALHDADRAVPFALDHVVRSRFGGDAMSVGRQVALEAGFGG
jgi:hypothetical protein